MAFDGKSEHYCMNGMEAIDVIEAYGLNFALGNLPCVSQRPRGRKRRKNGDSTFVSCQSWGTQESERKRSKRMLTCTR